MNHIRTAVRAAFAQLDERLRRQLELPAPSRQPLLDPGTTLLPGDLGLVGARSADDAERILSVIALDAAADRDVLVVAQDINWTHHEMVSIASGIAVGAMRRPDTLTRADISRIVDAEDLIAKLPLTLASSNGYAINDGDVTAWLETHAGLAVLPSAWPASLGHDEDSAAAFVRRMKAIARGTSGTILMPWRLTAHRRNDPRPMLRDLAVSGAAEDDSDLVVLFHESEYGVEVSIAKNRHGRTGHLFDSRDLSSSY